MARCGTAAAVACALLLAQLLVGPLAAAAQPQQGRRLLSSPPPSGEHADKIIKYIARHQRPAQKTIHTEDGDIVDCVKIADQHTMQDAKFKDHKIQMKPPSLKASDNGKVNSSHVPVTQTWGSCPEGTIPVRRLTHDEVARAGSLPDFFKKHPKGHGGGHQSNNGLKGKNSTGAPGNETLTAGMMKGSGNTTKLNYMAIQKPSYAGHEYAIAEYSGNSGLIYGTEATFNVWNPYVEFASEFSLSQLWLVAGSYYNGDLNTIEAGWQLYPNKYGDWQSRLFIYWTRDAYKSTGCYNLDCSGFVQTNGNVYLGGRVTPVSWYGTTQWEFNLLVFKDPGSGHWWLRFQNQWVGYWPWWIFNRLNSHAEVVQWGGEIVNSEPYGRHTRTYMGSGWYAAKGWSYAAYIRNIQFVNQYNSLYNLDYAISSYVSNSNCYSIWVGANPGGWEAYFYFGDDEVARAGSLPDFFKKHPKGHGGGHQPNKGPEGKSSTVAPGNETLTAGMKKGSGNTTRLNYVAIQPPSYAGHEYAIAEYTGTSEPLYGTMATFNVWNPLVEWASEFSLSQLWLVAGSIDNGDLNTMEGGWQLYPNKYGDLHSRLFNYWTRDAYKSTGCYNLDCSGFVQTNIDVLLGGVLTASWYGSTQYEYTLLDFKSPRTGHWWLQFQGQWVGYWPWWIFNRLAYAAEAAHWGGEVMNIEPYRRHTRTTMGSGNYASKGWSYAAYIRNIRFVNHYNVLNNLDYALSSYTSNSNCYSIWLGANPGGWEACIYFGGLGLSSICV
eukprot:SM000093S24456  [mRNA]  locus=s93:440233:449969:- [translate_table: standard]